MKFIGYDGEIEILDNAVKIQKKKKDTGRVIGFPDIVSVTVKKPVFTAAGCIHVQVLGARTYSAAANATHYALDMNAICFRKPQYDEALTFKDALDRAIAGSKEHSKETGATVDMDGLRQLKQLLDDGIITQEDYDRKKAAILGL